MSEYDPITEDDITEEELKKTELEDEGFVEPIKKAEVKVEIPKFDYFQLTAAIDGMNKVIPKENQIKTRRVKKDVLFGKFIEGYNKFFEELGNDFPEETTSFYSFISDAYQKKVKEKTEEKGEEIEGVQESTENPEDEQPERLVSREDHIIKAKKRIENADKRKRELVKTPKKIKGKGCPIKPKDLFSIFNENITVGNKTLLLILSNPYLTPAEIAKETGAAYQYAKIWLRDTERTLFGCQHLGLLKEEFHLDPEKIKKRNERIKEFDNLTFGELRKRKKKADIVVEEPTNNMSDFSDEKLSEKETEEMLSPDIENLENPSVDLMEKAQSFSNDSEEEPLYSDEENPELAENSEVEEELEDEEEPSTDSDDDADMLENLDEYEAEDEDDELTSED